MTFCAEGGKASVYQLKDEWGGAFALKVFFPRFRTARTVLAANRLNLLGGMPGLQAARRAVIASDDPILHRHADLKYAVLMPWIGGPTWWDYLENSRHKKTDAAAAFRLAACLLEVIAGFEKRGMAHSDLCAANIIIDFERRDLQVVDLEDMYMPGVPNPVLRTTGQVGYQHPSGETTWNPAGDRFASAVLAAEVLLSAIPDAELSGGLFGWDVTAARERFLRADNLLAHWYAGFARLFRQSWASSTLLRCPSVADLHAALVDDGPAGSPTRDTVIIPVVAHANGAQDRAKPKRIFISYSHSDARFRDELLKHLMSLKREGLVEAWHDQDIAAGMEWEKEIVEQLLGADVILLLISADFLSSDYCYGREMQTALRLHQERSASVIPVIVRDVDWQNSPFASLEAVPVKNARVFPLNRWSSRDAAWLNVVLAIRRLVSA
jgi:hypothetical protein